MVIIGYDGSPAAHHAIVEAGKLLRGHDALVVVAWTEGAGFEYAEIPATSFDAPPATIDVRTAMEVDHAMSERAQRLAQEGARIAREAGFLEPQGLAAAEDVGTSVAEMLVAIAQERHADAIVVGAHGHGRLGEVFLGSTSRDVIRHSPLPVVVTRATAE